MKLDLRKLYAFKKLEIDTDLDLSKVDYQKLNIQFTFSSYFNKTKLQEIEEL